MRKLVQGVGVNDAGYVVNPVVNGKQTMCPAYQAWKHMLERCYSTKCQERRPTYINTKVCKEWHSFTNFRAWWSSHHVVGYQLDKDIIGNGDVYSPETCIYVPQWLNKFIIDRGAARGEWPIGVYYDDHAGKYKAQCNHPFGKLEHLGLFTNPEAAHQSWLNRKLSIASELKQKMDEIDERIYYRVIDIIINSK